MFAKFRPADTDAIVKMSERNLRHLTIPKDPKAYLTKRRLDQHLELVVPDYRTEYSEVAFSQRGYAAVRYDSMIKAALVNQLYHQDCDCNDFSCQTCAQALMQTLSNLRA